MNFVIPMAGKGARFTEAGFKLPKMLLKAQGKTLLQWSLDSLPLHLSEVVVFVGLSSDEKLYSMQRMIENLYPELNSKFIFIDHFTRGQAETASLALRYCRQGAPLVIFNIDTCFGSSTLAGQLQDSEADGILGSFVNTEDRFSFAALDKEGKYVVDVREKEVISNNALTGLYHFRKIKDFEDSFEFQLRNNLTVKGEYYIAPLYNQLIAQGKKIVLDHVTWHYILGTPPEYRAFASIDARSQHYPWSTGINGC